MRKKGSIGLETLFLIVVVFAMALTVFMGKSLVDDLNADIQGDSDFSAEAKAVSLDVQTRYPLVMDGAVIFLYVMVWIAILISAYVIDTHPVFFIVSLIVIVITLIVALSISDGYTELMTDADFSTMPTSFPMIHFLLSNLFILTVLQAFSVAVVLYGKYRSGAG